MLVLSQDGEKIADTSVGYFKYWETREIKELKEKAKYEVLFITANETEVFGAYRSKEEALNAIQSILQDARLEFKVCEMEDSYYV